MRELNGLSPNASASAMNLALTESINKIPGKQNSLTPNQLAEKNEGDKPSKADGQENRALEAARKFEALLVHSLLKNMRKTTLAENTSNESALYDDMLDQQLANTITESGGLGLAERIAEQLNANSNQLNNLTRLASKGTEQAQNDRLRLRDLAQNIQSRSLPDEKISLLDAHPLEDAQTTDINRLRMVTSLWSSHSNTASDMPDNHSNFVQNLMPVAQQGAQRIGTSPTALVAIAALETGWGKSMITDAQGRNSHNLFGIKASANDPKYAVTKTTEYYDGAAQKISARFKVFEDDADSVSGFTDFLKNNPRYKNALSHANEPERFVRELQKAGYATDPHYADKVISIMRQIEQQSLPL